MAAIFVLQRIGIWLNPSVNSAGALLPALPPVLQAPSRKSQTGRQVLNRHSPQDGIFLKGETGTGMR